MRYVLRHRRNRSQWIANKTNCVDCQCMLIFGNRHDAERVRQLAADECFQNTFHRQRRRQIDVLNLRVRHSAANQLDVRRTRQLNVIRKSRLPGYFCPTVYTSKRSLSPTSLESLAGVEIALTMRRLPRYFGTTEIFLSRPPVIASLLRRGPLDRFDDAVVAGTATDVSGQSLGDLFVIGFRIPGKQCFRNHQYARRAITALRCTEIGKSLLQRMQRITILVNWHSSRRTSSNV